MLYTPFVLFLYSFSLEIVDEFPKTISGKIKRTDLRENHKA